MTFTTDAEWRALQDKIQGWIDTWVDRMWLNWWRIESVWYRGDIPDSNRQAVPPGRKALMDCTADYHYFEATVRINLELALQYDDAYLERVVVHELAHVVLNEMRDWKPSDKGMKREERVATHLQKIVCELVREKEEALRGGGVGSADRASLGPLGLATAATRVGAGDSGKETEDRDGREAEQGDGRGSAAEGEQGPAGEAAQEGVA